MRTLEELEAFGPRVLAEMVVQLEEQFEAEEQNTAFDLDVRKWRQSFTFKDPSELQQAVLRGWGYLLCEPGKWLEVHAVFGEETVTIIGPAIATGAIQEWGYLLTEFQQSALREHDQGILIVREYGCDVHPRPGTKRQNPFTN